MRIDLLIYPLVSGVVFALLSLRAAVYLFGMDLGVFQNAFLWSSLAVVVAFHLLILLAAYLYEHVYKTFSALFLYVIFLLGLYFLFLLNSLLFRVPEDIWLRVSVVLIFVPLVFRRKSFRFSAQPSLKFSWQDGLIAVWLLNAILLSAKLNFNPHRKPFIDELSLWYVSARDMIEQGISLAHTAAYGGAGAHSLGVPFIASLPAKFWGAVSLHTIYFMPIVVIFSLLIFLRRIKTFKWAFFFFICALSAVFYERAWLSYFLYGFVYGEGLSTAILLIVMFEWIRLRETETLNNVAIWVFSFGLGLLALTKSPLALMVFPIFITFLWSVYRTKKKEGVKCSWLGVALACIFAALASILWKMFVVKSHVYYQGFHVPLGEIISRVAHPHEWMLRNAFELMWGNSNGFFYYGSIALIFYLLFSRRIIYGIPLLVLFLQGFVYYAYFHFYGVNSGDPGSLLRYWMPAFLPLFYLGALGFENFMIRLEERTWPVFLKAGLMVLVCGLLLWGLVETRTTEKIFLFFCPQGSVL